MKNYREKSLQEWIQNTAPKITPKSFDTVHLDEIGYKQEDYWSRPFLEQIFIETVVLIGNLVGRGSASDVLRFMTTYCGQNSSEIRPLRFLAE